MTSPGGRRLGAARGTPGAELPSSPPFRDGALRTLRRTFDVTRFVIPEGVDVVACVRCGGRLKVRAVVTAAASTAKNLASKAPAEGHRRLCSGQGGYPRAHIAARWPLHLRTQNGASAPWTANTPTPFLSPISSDLDTERVHDEEPVG